MAEFDVVLKLRVEGTEKQVETRIAALIEALREKEDWMTFVDAVIEKPIRWARKRG